MCADQQNPHATQRERQTRPGGKTRQFTAPQAKSKIRPRPRCGGGATPCLRATMPGAARRPCTRPRSSVMHSSCPGWRMRCGQCAPRVPKHKWAPKAPTSLTPYLPSNPSARVQRARRAPTNLSHPATTILPRAPVSDGHTARTGHTELTAHHTKRTIPRDPASVRLMRRGRKPTDRAHRPLRHQMTLI